MSTPAKKTTPPAKAAPAKAAVPPAKTASAKEPHFPDKEWVDALGRPEGKPEVTKAAAAPAKAPEKRPEPKKDEPEEKKEPVKPPTTSSATTQDAPPSPSKTETKGEKKASVREQLDAVAADRGWVASERPGDWDAVYTKSNPVLGGYEHLRVNFKGASLGEVEHENLNQLVPGPEKASPVEHAVSVLTGEPI